MKLYIKANNLSVLKNIENLINANNAKAKVLLNENSHHEYHLNTQSINKLQELSRMLFYENKPFKQLIKGVYFGNSTCEHLLSSELEVIKAKRICEDLHYNFVFVFPPLGETRIQKAKEILEFLNKNKCEIVANDFGVLNLALGYENIKPILGINFTKTIKNAFIDAKKPDIKEEILKNQQNLLSRLEFEVAPTREFYKSIGISRFSAENISYDFEFLDKSPYMQVDIYYPNITISNSKACDIAGLFKDKAKYFVQKDCKKHCNLVSLEFEHSKILRLYQRYNAIYKSYVDIKIPKVVYKSKKNRLVWEIFG